MALIAIHPNALRAGADFVGPTFLKVELQQRSSNEVRTHTLAAADVDGDARIDLVVNNSGDLVLLRGNGDGTFQEPVGIASLGSAGKVVLADLDGDRAPDIVVQNFNAGGFSVFFNNGHGSFSAAMPYSGVVGSASDIVVKDLNGDNIPDILVSDLNRLNLQIGVLLGSGGGSFLRIDPVPLSGLSDGVTALFVDDFDQDGKQDIVASLFSGSGASRQIVVFYGHGDARFDPPVALGLSSPLAFCSTDIDGDGISDLIFTYGGGVFTLVVHRDRTFGLLKRADGSGPRVSNGITVADINGDHIADILVPDFDNGDIWLYAGKSAGEFETANTFGSGTRNPYEITVADINGDGRPDLIISGKDPDFVSVFLNVGKPNVRRNRAARH